MPKLFDDYEDFEEEEKKDSLDDFSVNLETVTHLERIQSIFEESNIDYEEADDTDFETVLVTKEGVAFMFNEEGELKKVVSSYEE